MAFMDSTNIGIGGGFGLSGLSTGSTAVPQDKTGVLLQEIADLLKNSGGINDAHNQGLGDKLSAFKSHAGYDLNIELFDSLRTRIADFNKVKEIMSLVGDRPVDNTEAFSSALSKGFSVEKGLVIASNKTEPALKEALMDGKDIDLGKFEAQFNAYKDLAGKEAAAKFAVAFADNDQNGIDKARADILQAITEYKKKEIQNAGTQAEQDIQKLSESERKALNELGKTERETFLKFTKDERDAFNALGKTERETFLKLSEDERKAVTDLGKAQRGEFLKLSEDERKAFTELGKAQREAFLELSGDEQQKVRDLSVAQQKKILELEREVQKSILKLSKGEQETFLKLSKTELENFGKLAADKQKEILASVNDGLGKIKDGINNGVKAITSATEEGSRKDNLRDSLSTQLLDLSKAAKDLEKSQAAKMPASGLSTKLLDDKNSMDYQKIRDHTQQFIDQNTADEKMGKPHRNQMRAMRHSRDGVSHVTIEGNGAFLVSDPSRNLTVSGMDKADIVRFNVATLKHSHQVITVENRKAEDAAYGRGKIILMAEEGASLSAKDVKGGVEVTLGEKTITLNGVTRDDIMLTTVDKTGKAGERVVGLKSMLSVQEADQNKRTAENIAVKQKALDGIRENFVKSLAELNAKGDTTLSLEEADIGLKKILSMSAHNPTILNNAHKPGPIQEALEGIIKDGKPVEIADVNAAVAALLPKPATPNAPPIGAKQQGTGQQH